MIQSQKTINQAVAEWLKLSPKEVKDFKKKFKKFKVNFKCEGDNHRSMHDDREIYFITRDIISKKLYSIFKENPLALPLLLKYKKEKSKDHDAGVNGMIKRTGTQDIITKDFLKNLVQNTINNYSYYCDNLVAEKSKEIEKYKTQLKSGNLDKLDHNAVHKSIDSLKYDIKCKEEEKGKLKEQWESCYNSYYNSTNKQREALALLDKIACKRCFNYNSMKIETHSTQVFDNLVLVETEKKFIEYFKQLDPEKTKEAYSKIAQDFHKQEKELDNIKQKLSTIKLALIAVIFAPLVIILSPFFALFFLVKKLNITNNREKMFSLENKDLHFNSTEEVNTPKNQELHSTSDTNSHYTKNR